MSEYMRMTAYLYLYEDVRRIRSVGYLRRNRSQEQDRLFIHIGGFYTEGTALGKVYTVCEEGDHYIAKEAGDISVQHNHGETRFILQKEQAAHVGVMIRIQDQVCAGWYDKEVFISNIYFSGENPKAAESVIMGAAEPEQEQSFESAAQTESEYADEMSRDDTWQKLSGIYPMVYPFEYPVDAEYLSVTPNEILQLPDSEHILLQNSFLQHAYYQYKYIIIGKKKSSYYIGVPGIYHEREVMMAKMFGFENFLCAKKEQPVQGCFGYYMKEILIDTTK